jgi:hypothetical protein
MTTTELQQALAYLFPTAAVPGASNWTLTTDANGNASIVLWNNSLGTQPTIAQLTTALTACQVQQAQTAQNVTLQAAYTKARYGTPVTLTSGSTMLTFPTDTATQTNVMGYLTAFTSANAPAQMPLQDASETIQMLTFAQLQTLAQTIATESISAYSTLVSLSAQVAAATTVAAVQAVTWPTS